MRAHGRCQWGLMLLVLGTGGARAWASGPVTASTDDHVARLEAQLAQQQEQLEALRAQLAVGEAQEADAVRAAAMRQQIREILSEQEFRESLMPSVAQAGYDKGFFIRSSDDKFLMTVNGQVQFRWTYYNTQTRNHYTLPRLDRDDRTGFDLQRVRLALKGHVYTPDLTYYLQLRAEASQAYDATIRDAYLNYRFVDEFQFQAGIFKVAAAQSTLSSSRDLQFPDRPMVEQVFGLGRALGARLWGQLAGKRVEYFVDVVNSFNDYSGRTITPDPTELDNNPGIAARLVWHALGEHPGKDLASEADLEFHDSPALDFAFHYAFNQDNGDARGLRIPFPRRSALPGGFGLTTTNGLQINQFGWATAFKWQGFSARGEYFLRLVDPTRARQVPATPWWLLSGDDSTTAQHGAYVQAGYFLPIPGLEKKLEVVARVGGISALAEQREGTWEYAGGVNYYLQGNNVKLQADVTKIQEAPISSSGSSLANVNDDALVFRVQLQVAF